MCQKFYYLAAERATSLLKEITFSPPDGFSLEFSQEAPWFFQGAEGTLSCFLKVLKGPEMLEQVSELACNPPPPNVFVVTVNFSQVKRTNICITVNTVPRTVLSKFSRQPYKTQIFSPSYW